MIFVFISLFFCVTTAYSAPPADESTLNKKITERKKALNTLKDKIKSQNNDISFVKKKEVSVFASLKALNRGIISINNELGVNIDVLKKRRVEKKAIQKNIRELRSDISKKRALLSDTLKSLYKNGRFSYLKIFFSAESFSDLLKRIKYSRMLANIETNIIKERQKEETELRDKRERIKDKEREIKDIIKKISGKKNALEKEKNGKKRLLKSIQVKKEMYVRLKKESEEAAKKLRSLLKELDQRYKNLIKSKSLAKKQISDKFRLKIGNLQWPVKGRRLVSSFGKIKDPKFNVVTFNNGIEIRTKKGETVTAVHGGKIIFGDWFKGYGKLVILDNGEGYYTLYGHLDKIISTSGTYLDAGEDIGKAGDTGSVNGDTLYFEIRKQGKPVNPSLWLR